MSLPKSIQATAAIATLMASALASAAPMTFFGEDAGLGENTRLSSTPNADAARNAFLSKLSGVGTETFESFTAGSFTNLNVSFPGAGTATINSGTIANVPTGTNGFGRYPISGNQYLETSSANLTIAFDQAVAAFGFYGVDIGDFNGQVTLTFVGGSSSTINIGNTVNAAGGSVLYFGFIDTDNLFTSVTFGNTNAGVDGFGFDDFTIGTVDQVVPNPASAPGTLALVGASLLALGAARRRRQA